MFERLRFARYALRFERAFRNDDWEPVRACFHPDGRYVIEGSGSAYDGEARGAAAIVALFKRMLDEVDRRFDRRIPRITSLPRVRGGELSFRWSARYVLGRDSVVVTGTSCCRFDGGRIALLRDVMLEGEVARWVALAARGRSGPPVSP